MRVFHKLMLNLSSVSACASRQVFFVIVDNMGVITRLIDGWMDGCFTLVSTRFQPYHGINSLTHVYGGNSLTHVFPAFNSF